MSAKIEANTVYTLESIRNLDGTPHEREARRKGQRVNIVFGSIGYSAVIVYVGQSSHIRTSPITAIERGIGTLTVRTQNSVYTFRKETANENHAIWR